MRAVWDNAKTYKFIEMFQSHPELWDTTYKGYRDRKRKAQAMEDIAGAVGVDVKEANRKLHNLRCQLNGEVRKMRKRQGAKKSTWVFYDAVKFMSGLSESVQTIGTNSELDSAETVASQVHREPEPSDVSFVSPGASEKSKKNKSRPRRKRTASSEIEELCQEARVAQDDSDIFGAFVAAEIRQIRCEARRKKLKRIIMRAIIEMGGEEDNDSFESQVSTPPLDDHNYPSDMLVAYYHNADASPK